MACFFTGLGLAMLGCRLGDLVESPEALPGAPDNLTQTKSDGSSTLSIGTATDEQVVVLGASLNDPDARDQVRLEVEVRLLGVAFSDTATGASSALGAPGHVSLEVTGLADDARYHWQARAVDGTGRAGPWVVFGGNAESDPDFRVAIPEAPGPSPDLAQLKSDGVTPLAVGAATNEATVVLQARVTDPDPGDTLRLQVERQPVGSPFSGTPSATSTAGVASGGVIPLVVSGLVDNTAYHWQARAIDQTNRTGPWVAFGANADADPDYVVVVAENPTVTGLAQYRSDGATDIGTGGSTNESSVAVKGLLTDPDPGDTLRLEVERQPLSAAFTNTPTATSVATATGGVATVVLAGLTDNTRYHWQARAIDQTGRASAWAAFGGNAEIDPDFDVAIPEPPGAPADLAQLQSDGVTPLASGATTDQSTVVISATVTDPDPGDLLRLQVERQPVTTAFLNTPTITGAAGVTSGGVATATLTGLADNTGYHWQARTIDQTGRASAWIVFGSNAETDPDYTVAVPEPPGAPTSLRQFRQNGTTPLTVGDTTGQTTVVFKASVVDPDPGDSLRLQVERQPLGTPFADVPTVTGTAVVASGGTVAVTVTGLVDNAAYHWRGRAIDRSGRTGPWVPFGDNAETDPDFVVAIPEAPLAPTGLTQMKSDGVTTLVLGGSTNEATAIFSGLVSDPDPGNLLRLEVEAQPVGAAFTNTPTATGTTGETAGHVARVTVSGLLDNTAYHWQARTIDNTGATGPWLAFGGNAEGAPDFTVDFPNGPATPSGLAQFTSDSVTSLVAGATTTEATVVIKATVTDPDLGDTLRLQVERQPVGTPFTDTPSATSPVVASGNLAVVTLAGLIDNTGYHWQARTIDQTNRTSGWVSFGANLESVADYTISVPDRPAAPANLEQLAQNGQTAIAIGGTTNQTTVVLKATLTDPDPADSVQLEVEVRAVGVAFTGSPTHIGILIAIGGTGQVSVGLSTGTDYHWQARARDRTGRVGPWVSFGSNDETATDFRVGP